MRIHVLFFGVLKDLAGIASEKIELPEGSKLTDLLHHYSVHRPDLSSRFPGIALSINEEFADPSASLADGDQVALLPPVSGGFDPIPAAGHCSLVRDPIDCAAIATRLKRAEDGATLAFEGIVRNNTRGRETLFLEYESYEQMALKRMEELALEALASFAIRDVVMVHRLGRLAIGDTSVLIVVASAHRGPAFEACRWLIDTLKKTVPIWKKEHFVDGAVWADGEPFPANIAGISPVSGDGKPQAAETPDPASH